MAFSAQTNTQAAPANTQTTPVDFQSAYQRAVDLIRLQNAVESGDFGRDYGGTKRKEAVAEYQRLGGDKAIQQILSDPRYGEHIAQRIREETRPGGYAGLGSLWEGVGMFAGGAAGLSALGGAASLTGAGAGAAAGTTAAGEFAGAADLATGTGLAGGAAGSGAAGMNAAYLSSIGAGAGGGATAGTAAGFGTGAAAVPAATTAAGLGAGTVAAGLGTGAATGGLLGMSGNTLGALALGGASLYGSRQSQKAAERAGEIQAQAGQQALTEQARQFDIGRAGQQPYMAAGAEALAEERALLGLGGESPQQRLRALMQAPGVQFARQQGQRVVETGAAARGGLFSGATGKALQRYGQQFATGQYGNRLSQLSNLAQRGQSAASGQANLGANYASNVGNLYTNMGASQAGSEIAQGQARQAGITGVATAAERLFNPPRQQPSLQDLMKQLG